MARLRWHPKYHKNCIFCNKWMGEAKLTFISNTVGYEFDSSVKGKCLCGSEHTAIYGCTTKFEPTIEAKKLL